MCLYILLTNQIFTLTNKIQTHIFVTYEFYSYQYRLELIVNLLEESVFTHCNMVLDENYLSL